MPNLRNGHSVLLRASVLGLVVLTSASTGIGSQNLGAVRVDLGQDRMIPGFNVTVPCFLEAPGNVKVGKIELEVTFPHDKVSFEHIRRGLISDQINAEITSQVQVSEVASALSIVKISITSGETIPIPSGFLFDLVFKIGPEVPMDSPPVVLENSSRTYRWSDPTEVLPGVEGQDGLIEVVSEPPPVAACLFYMH
ncbi:hypothetical protein MYX82_00585 [Acidobacteria bacterium AH-259-D05]|nr:hypothetical protein [Acidobacteria bacterium AH-259-D05]